MSIDGGYYAIKGFEFQVDKAILEVLQSIDENAPVFIEQIQDINTDTFVMQVKYRETQDYMPSKIREPVIQLIEEYINVPSKEYCLYCYFKDKESGLVEITLDELNSILNITLRSNSSEMAKRLKRKMDGFETETRENFIQKFKLIFAPTFQEQFENAINELQKFDFCNDFDEALVYYSLITDYLRKLVANNINGENRSCTKTNIIDLIKHKRKIVFNSAFRDYKGDQQYFSYIKAKYFTFRNIDNWERFIIIELYGSESVSTIKRLVLKIKEKFFVETARVLKSGAPYIHLRDISKNNLKQLKTELFSEGYMIKDGYDFKDAEFNKDAIILKSTTENKTCLKFIDSEEHLLDVIETDLNSTKECYQFFMNVPLNIDSDIEKVDIQIKEISDIHKIL